MRRILLILFSIQSCISLAQTVDANGKKQGYWKKKDDKTNKLIYEGEFKDDKPVGKFKYYYPNDSVRAVMFFKKDGKSCYAKLFHANGKRMAEGNYVGKEVKDSIWTYYDEAGVLISRETFKNGNKHGMSYVYTPDGKLSEEKMFKDDVEDGSFKQYFDGVALRSRGNYVKGKLDGRIIYYYPNGTEVAAGYYKNGLKVGPWIYKTEKGAIKEKELYKNGILASPKETEEFFAKNKIEPTSSDTKKPETKKPQAK